MEALSIFRPFLAFFTKLTLQPSLLPFKTNDIHHRSKGSLQFQLVIQSILHLIFIVGAIYVTLNSRWRILYADDYNGHILGALSMIIVFLTHGFSILEILVSLEPNRDLWIAFQDIENRLVEIGCKQQLRAFLRKLYLRYFINFFISVALYVIAYAVNLYVTTLDNVKLIHLLLVFNGSIILTCFRLALIELHVRALSCYMATMNVELRNVVEATEYGKKLNNFQYNYKTYRKVAILNDCYGKCSEALDQMKNIFAVSIFWNCLKIKVLILDDIYSLVYQLVRGSFFGENTILRVPNKVFFTNWVNSCENLFGKQLDLIETINKIDVSGHNNPFRDLVLHFQTNLNHNKFKISAAGMFYPSYGCIAENVISGLTYVTFMVQLTK